MVLKATVQKGSTKQSLPKVTSEAAVCRYMFFKIGALRNFAIFTGKQLCWILFLAKLQALQPGTLFKRGFNTGLFM